MFYKMKHQKNICCGIVLYYCLFIKLYRKLFVPNNCVLFYMLAEQKLLCLKRFKHKKQHEIAVTKCFNLTVSIKLVFCKGH